MAGEVGVAAVHVDGVSVRVGDITLLPPVNLSVAGGECLAIRGANGSGKSTLLRVLAGVTPPSSGTVLIQGLAPRERDSAFRRTLAAMVGLPPLAPDMTVRDSLTLVASTWYARPDETTQAVDAVLDAFRLESLDARFPHELSSGQLQLVGISCVLVRPSAVLVLDEPEQRLDPDRLALVADALTARRYAGAAVVVATHSEALASAVADQTLFLDS